MQRRNGARSVGSLLRLQQEAEVDEEALWRERGSHKIRNRPQMIQYALLVVFLFVVSTSQVCMLWGRLSKPKRGGSPDGTQQPRQPFEELQEFQSQHRDTPGAYFIHLLQINLYNSYHNRDEFKRSVACQEENVPNKGPTLSNVNLCYAGATNHKLAVQELHKPGSKVVNATVLEKQTHMKISLGDPVLTLEHENPGNHPSVYGMRHYGPSDATTKLPVEKNIDSRLIPSMGTQMACLPLMLASAAASMAAEGPAEKKVVAELGPAFGLSSKCLASGIRLVGKEIARLQQSGRGHGPLLYAYDSFAGEDRLKSLQDNPQNQWVLDDFFPHVDLKGTTDYTEEKDRNSNFLFLWQRAVLPMLPNAQTSVGKMDPRQHEVPWYMGGWSNHWFVGLFEQFKARHNKEPSLSLVVLGSTKVAKSLNDELAVVLTNRDKGSGSILRPGTILVLMDFASVANQNQQVYACLRHALLPVYISWNKGHWAFVVTKQVNLKVEADCLLEVGAESEMSAQLKLDLDFVSRGLRPMSAWDWLEGEEDDPWAKIRHELYESMSQTLRWRLLAG